MTVSNTDLLGNWNSLSINEKFKFLNRIEDLEVFASRHVTSYLSKHSSEEVFNSLAQDKDGIEILRKYQKMTDDIMDLPFIHDENHYWNQNRESILAHLFTTSEKWFGKIYDPTLTLKLEDLRKNIKRQGAIRKTESTYSGIDKLSEIIARNSQKPKLSRVNQAIDLLGCLWKFVLAMLLGLLIYKGIPIAIMYFGHSLDRLFGFDSFFLGVSLFFIIIYFVYSISSAKKRRR
jgi:hypothetical protein